MSKFCLNPKDNDIIKFAKAVGVHPTVAAAKIGTYLDKTLTSSLVTEYLKGNIDLPLPTIEEFNDYAKQTKIDTYPSFKNENDAVFGIDDYNLKTGDIVRIGNALFTIKDEDDEDIEFNLLEDLNIEKDNITSLVLWAAKQISNILNITIVNELDKIYRPDIRVDRVNLISREFVRAVTLILKTKRPNSSREEIIDEFGIDRIFNVVKKNMFLNSQNVEKFTDYQRDEFKKIYDNFSLLTEETSKFLSQYENIEIEFVENVLTKLNNTDKDKSIPDSLNESEDGIIIDEDENNSVKDGWMIKHRHLDPIESISLGTRRILMNVVKLGYDKNIERDDLGNPRYIDPEIAHNILIQHLSNMTEAEQMIPALQDLAYSKPWVSNVVNILQENSVLHSMFYLDFRKNFISYWAQIRGKKDGHYTYLTKNVNKPNTVQYLLNEWRSTIESGSKLSKYSIYDELGNINNDNLEIIKNTINEISDDIKGKSLKDVNSYVESNIGKLKDLFSSIGINIDTLKLLESINYAKDIEGSNIIVNHGLNNILSNIYSIVNKLSTKSTKNIDLINAFPKEYKSLATILEKSYDELMVSSIYENKKSYYSYTSPSYMLDLMNKLKGKLYSEQQLKNFYDNEFKKYNWFFKNGEWLNVWLDRLYNDPKARDIIEHKVNLNFNRIEYSNLGPLDHTLMMINEYYSSVDNNTAFYPVFILADAPSAEFVRFYKYTKDNTTDWKNTLADNFVKLALQEYSRIKLVNSRREQIDKKLILPIDNFDKKGNTFLFLPFLNKYMNLFNDVSNKDDVEYTTEFINTLKNIIIEETDLSYQKELQRYEKIGLFEKTDDGKNLKYLLDFTTYELAKEGLEEYFWNQRFAQSLMLLLTTTDIAYYKNITDLQKRMKEIHTPGSKLDTSEKLFGRQYENTIYLKDYKAPSNSIEDIEKALDNLVNELMMTKKDKQFILDKYKTNEVTDAQAYRCLSSYRAVMAMSGKWNLLMQDVFDKLKALLNGEKVKLTAEDFNIVWQPYKPFMYTQTSNYGLVTKNGIDLIKVPTQNKNAEFLLLFSSILKSSPLLSALNEFMEEEFLKGGNKGIDVILFSTTVKVGGQGAIDLNPDIYNTKDSIKKALLEAVNSNASDYNYQVVHKLPYSDYSLVLPVPNHYMDSIQNFGTQIRKLIKGDLSDSAVYTINGKDYTKKELITLYDNLIIENLLLAHSLVKERLKNKFLVSKTLLQEATSNKRSSIELIRALSLAPDLHFILPLSDPILSERTQSMLHSIIRNLITKLKTKGGSLVHVTSWGVHNDLNVVWGEKDGKKYIEKIECYMPWYSQKYFKELMNPETGELEIDKVPDDLRKIIGYRIPTENKYSMFPIYIQGFLPQNSGGTIMLPKEITTIAGLD